MANPTDPHPVTPPPMRGGGCMIAAGAMIGPIVGLAFGETSIGLIVGVAIGIAGAITLTIFDRQR